MHGYDFVNNDGDPMDDNGHGTHVSGTIGAVGNNALGVAGVNWLTQIMGLKFLGSNGSGPISAAVSALNYATMMRNSYGVNIRLTNNSWGGGAFSQALSDAITASGNAGMLFVAAAGNGASDIDATPYYPASYDLPNVIAVAATDSNDALASFSNYGASTVDLAAPGSSILSTYPNNTYVSMSGTSMAAPHVSGAAALAWSYAPGATYQQIRDAMFDGVDPLPALSGDCRDRGPTQCPEHAQPVAQRRGRHVGHGARDAPVGPRRRGPLHPAQRADRGRDLRREDVDIYQLTATAGGSITAITSQPAGGTAMDTVLRLFNSAGTELAVNDNFNGGSYSRLDYTFTTAGTYYLGVSGRPTPTTTRTPAAAAPRAAPATIVSTSASTSATRSADAVSTGLVLGGRFTQPSTPLGDGPVRQP